MALTDIIVRNPYRVLGVFANATTKDLVAQGNRLTAFARVGRATTEAVDLTALLPPPERTAAGIKAARDRLTGTRDRVRYGLFWFIALTPLDTLALRHLSDGDSGAALEVWQRDDNTSSLHNRAVLELLMGHTSESMTLASRVTHNHEHRANLLMALGGNDCRMSEDELSRLLIDTYIEQNGSAGITFNQLNLSHAARADLDYVVRRMGIDQERDIEHLLDMARKVIDHNAAAQLDMGRQLVEQTARALHNLAALHGSESVYYRTLADNVAIAIEQCAIKYYNHSADSDRASRATALERKAREIARTASTRDQIDLHIARLSEESQQADTEEVLRQVGRDIVAMTNRQLDARTVTGTVRQNVDLLDGAAPDERLAAAARQLADIALGQLIEGFNHKQRQTDTLDDLQDLVAVTLDGLDQVSRLPVDHRATGRLHATRTTLERVRRQAQWTSHLIDILNLL